MTTDDYLRFGDWAMPNPNGAAFREALHAARYDPPGYLTRPQVLLLLSAAESYHCLATHPAGTESMIKKLRAIRRRVCK